MKESISDWKKQFAYDPSETIIVDFCQCIGKIPIQVVNYSRLAPVWWVSWPTVDAWLKDCWKEDYHQAIRDLDRMLEAIGRQWQEDYRQALLSL